jgi:hypothetical protein
LGFVPSRVFAKPPRSALRPISAHVLEPTATIAAAARVHSSVSVGGQLAAPCGTTPLMGFVHLAVIPRLRVCRDPGLCIQPGRPGRRYRHSGRFYGSRPCSRRFTGTHFGARTCSHTFFVYGTFTRFGRPFQDRSTKGSVGNSPLLISSIGATLWRISVGTSYCPTR